MALFDKKEEVIDLVLTRKGRELLSKGKFKPDHYEFYDDEVIYDGSHSGITETQNEIMQRVKDSLTLKNQNDWTETVSSTIVKNKVAKPFKQLGSSLEVQQKPAWSVSVKEGLISSSITYTPLEATPVTNYSDDHVPQIDLTCDYGIYTEELGNTSQIWLHKSSNDILLDIEEKNVADTFENFSIEVFKYKTTADAITGIEQLSFSDEEYGDEFVEFYFNILTDKDTENILTIKYVDEEPDLIEEKDDCEVPENSCATDKIKQLREEIAKLKTEAIEQAINSGAFDFGMSHTEDECKKAYKCVKCTTTKETIWWAASDDAMYDYWTKACQGIKGDSIAQDPAVKAASEKSTSPVVAKDSQGKIIDWQWLMESYVSKCFALTNDSSHPCKPFFECLMKIQNPPGEFAKLPAAAQQAHKEKCAVLAPAALNSTHVGNLNIGKCDTNYCYEKDKE